MDSIELILGTMTFSDQADESASRKMIEQFTGAGHAELDTAHVYNQGKTETLLGELIKPADRAKLYIAGKVNPWNDSGPYSPLEIFRKPSPWPIGSRRNTSNYRSRIPLSIWARSAMPERCSWDTMHRSR